MNDFLAQGDTAQRKNLVNYLHRCMDDLKPGYDFSDMEVDLLGLNAEVREAWSDNGLVMA